MITGLRWSAATRARISAVAGSGGGCYNILMIARLREEARLGNHPRTAADLAVEHGGRSVGAAAVILAGTFASLMLAGISFLMEMPPPTRVSSHHVAVSARDGTTWRRHGTTRPGKVGVTSRGAG